MWDAARYPETGRKKRLKWRFFDFNVISLTREDTRIQYQAERRLARSNKGVINTCRPCEIKLKRESKKRDRERERIFPGKHCLPRSRTAVSIIKRARSRVHTQRNAVQRALVSDFSREKLVGCAPRVKSIFRRGLKYSSFYIE